MYKGRQQEILIIDEMLTFNNLSQSSSMAYTKSRTKADVTSIKA